MGKSKSLIVITVTAAFLIPFAASAQLSVENIGGTLGLGNADLKETVINIIQWFLGLLGLVAVVMVLYGGFIWMTAGGNEDKVDTAKQIISAASIGLVIVLISWSIVTFVLQTTSNVTGGSI